MRVNAGLLFLITVAAMLASGCGNNATHGRYKSGQGPSGKVSANQAINAEFEFTPPQSAAGIKLALWGGIDVFRLGRMEVDLAEIEATLTAGNYASVDDVSRIFFSTQHPDMHWYAYTNAEVYAAYELPDGQRRVVLLRPDDDGVSSAFLWSAREGMASPVFTQYFD
ncbi:hypothetical protein OT109_08555 [Phycisphaeraceae bacterium D3-23]